MPNYGNTNKKICFDSNDKLHADLKIRLHYDEIKIKELNCHTKLIHFWEYQCLLDIETSQKLPL